MVKQISSIIGFFDHPHRWDESPPKLVQMLRLLRPHIPKEYEDKYYSHNESFWDQGSVQADVKMACEKKGVNASGCNCVGTAKVGAPALLEHPCWWLHDLNFPTSTNGEPGLPYQLSQMGQRRAWLRGGT